MVPTKRKSTRGLKTKRGKTRSTSGAKRLTKRKKTLRKPMSKTSKKTTKRTKRKTLVKRRPRKKSSDLTIRRPKFEALSCVGGEATERVTSQQSGRHSTPKANPAGSAPAQQVSAMGAAPADTVQPGAGYRAAFELPRWATGTKACVARSGSLDSDATLICTREVTVDVSEIQTVEIGEFGTLSYRVKFTHAGKEISPWHDVPLYADQGKKTVNFICEIPKDTAKKFEISRTVPGNPIIQDTTKDGNPRSYQWPVGRPRMPWNYGALPQTWEDPHHEETDITVADGTHPKGDNDPIDVVELGSEPMATGEIAPVKVLGVLALVDDGETDWKLLVVRTDDPKFTDINTLAELMASPYAGEVAEIRDWLTNYKMPTKGIQNTIGFDGQAKDEVYAMSKVEQTNGFWIANTNSGRQNRELAH